MTAEPETVEIPDLPEAEALDVLPVLDPDLDYRDATEALKAMAEHIRLLQNRMGQMERVLMLQADINGKLLERLQPVAPASQLILPDRMN
jgi:hypothetical protein